MLPSTVTRRSLMAAAGFWTFGPHQVAAAVADRFQFETSIWTDSVLLDQSQRSFVLRDVPQPITLLKLWAGWCPACAAEMPQLTTLANTFGRDLEVILVSHPQYWTADQATARRRGLPFKLATFAPSNASALVQQALLNQEGLYSVPRSLMFRARDEAIVMKRESTTDWASGPMLSQIRNLRS